MDQCNVPSLITDMKELAEARDGELAVKLQPLADAYAAWIAELDDRRTERKPICKPMPTPRNPGCGGARKC